MDTISRKTEINDAVAEWRSQQPDLITCPMGTITLRQCHAYQHKYRTSDNVNVEGQKVYFNHPRFAPCRGCERFENAPDPARTDMKAHSWMMGFREDMKIGLKPGKKEKSDGINKEGSDVQC